MTNPLRPLPPTRASTALVAAWLHDRGWTTYSRGYGGLVSVRGPWQHPHHDGRPLMEWDGENPDMALSNAALALGLPEHHVRGDFARWHDSTTAHPWRYRDADPDEGAIHEVADYVRRVFYAPDVLEDPTYRATLDALQTAGLPLVGGGSWR